MIQTIQKGKKKVEVIQVWRLIGNCMISDDNAGPVNIIPDSSLRTHLLHFFFAQALAFFIRVSKMLARLKIRLINDTVAVPATYAVLTW